jgi:hypothetical protein
MHRAVMNMGLKHLPARMTRRRPLIIAALTPGLLAFGAWQAFLGQFRPNYSVAQVAGLVMTLLAIGIASAFWDERNGAEWLACGSTAAGISVGCWADWSEDETGLFVIGWFMVTMGALMGAFLIAVAVTLVRGRVARRSERGRYPVAPFAAIFAAGLCAGAVGDLGLRSAAVLAAVLIVVGTAGAAVAAISLLRSQATSERVQAWCAVVGSLVTLGLYVSQLTARQSSNSIGLGVVLMLAWALFALGAFTRRENPNTSRTAADGATIPPA